MKFTLILILALTGLSGKLAKAQETQDNYGHFSIVGRAMEAIRMIKKDCCRNIYVLIRGGKFKISGTETWTPADNHSDF